MDVDGFLEVLRGLRDGRIAKRAVDTPEPSAFARGILNSAPYTFLDDAPLEERRTQAVASRRILDIRTADELGALDPEAVARVREEAWPQPQNPEEVHEALLWMGYVRAEEAAPWQAWIDELRAGGRVVGEEDRFFAAEATRDPKAVLRGRMEALGPVVVTDPDEMSLVLRLESEGSVLRARIDGRQAWCDRRLLARIHRYTLDRLRKEIEPVTAAQFLRFLACWQHADGEHRLEGPRGVATIVSQLAGFEVPAAAWEASVLPARVRGYKREWLDQITLSGEVMWGRLWGAGVTPVRRTPVCLFPRDEAGSWSALSAAAGPAPEPTGTAAEVHAALARRGPMFLQELAKESRLPAASVEDGLAVLVALGRASCDSFGGLRLLVVPAWRRKAAGVTAGRWSLLERDAGSAPSAEVLARQMLRRTGVVFRKTLEREKHGVTWREIARACRVLEARGEIRGGRFVAGFDGEQYALPEAVTLLRSVRRRAEWPAGPPAVTVSAADPLNFRGILTPEEKVSPLTRQQVKVG
jgi:ATP-dependent Lhr-like helicase